MMRITTTLLFCVAACHDVVEPTSEYGNSFRYNKSGDDPHFRDGSSGDANLLDAVRNESDEIRARLGL